MAVVRERRIFVGPLRGPVRQVDSGNYQASSPTWSPDGKRIAFACGIGDRIRDRNRGLCVMPTAGGSVRRVVWLADSNESVEDASWSPHGERIVFTRRPLDTIYAVLSNGTGIRKLTTPWTRAKPQWSSLPRWAENGTRISYIHEGLPDTCEFFWMRPDGTDKTSVPGAALSRPCSSITAMSWSPDSRAIAYGVIRKYCYTAQLATPHAATLIRKPTIGCAGLAWVPAMNR